MGSARFSSLLTSQMFVAMKREMPLHRVSDCIPCRGGTLVRSQSVALLQQFVEQNDNHAGHDELHNKQQGDASAKVGRLTVKTGKNVDKSLAEGDDDSEDYAQSQ